MQVFKTYFKIIKKYKGTFILYFVIFVVLAVVMSLNTGGKAASEEQSFASTALQLAIIDKDGQTIGLAMKEYFKGEHEFVEIEDDEDVILSELYWRRLDYVLVIPKGYEESILNEEIPDMELECMKVPGNYASSYFETELSQYMSKLTGLTACGYSINEAEEELEVLKGKTARVEMASYVNENQNDVSTTFFLYVPYMFISLGVIGVGIVLLRFNEREVKDRMECSSTPLKVRTAGLIGGICIYGLIMLLVVVILAGILSKGAIFTDARTPYFLLNIFAMLLLGLSLGFLAGTVAKNNETVNGIVNIAGLGLCFIGGIFVPQEFFGDAVLRVAKLFPTYWYVATNEAIGGMTKMTSSLAKEIIPQIGVVACYAFAIFAVTMVIISSKRKRTA